MNCPLKIGNNDVYPSTMTVSLMDVQASDSGRDVTGTMHNNVVAKKWKIELEFLVPSEAEVATLLSAVNTPTFNVTFHNPMTQTDVTKKFYVGDRNIPVYMWQQNKITYNTLSFNLIEV